MDELDIMFTWLDDHLVLQVVLESGEQLNYEFDTEEVEKLYEFLQKKFTNESVITKVLKKLTDNNNSS